MRLRLALVAAALLVTACKKDVPSAVPAPPPNQAAAPTPAPAAPAPPEAKAAAPRVVAMEVTGDGFVPANVTVKAGEPLKLVVTRRTDETCATELLIEGTDINVPLPLNVAAEVHWTPARAGSVKFGCAMDKMIGGVLLVE